MSYWYCPNCQEELSGSRVTYQELCDTCGTRVLCVDETIDSDRLQEICKAEAEGRLVVLPCKVGDTVYFAYSGCEKINDAKVSGFWVAEKWIQLQLTNGSTFTCWDGPNNYFGKTVFLSKEAAEAALGDKANG